MLGAILSCDVVATHGFGSHNCGTKEVKQLEGKFGLLSLIRDQRTKKQGKRGRELPYT